jgi:hypothetical protein
VNKIFLILLLLSPASLLAQTVSWSQRFVNLQGHIGNNTTVVKKITYTISSNNSNAYLKCTTPFLISKDSIIFSDSIKAPGTSGNLFIKANVAAIDSIYKGTLWAIFPNKDTLSNKIMLLANGFNMDSVYSVASWNTKWLGDATNCNCDPALAINNVSSFLNELKPDIAALQEVVNQNVLAAMASGISNAHTSLVSTFGSFASNVNDLDYAGCQKLAYLFNTDLFSATNSWAFSKSLNQNLVNSEYFFSSGRYPFALNLRSKLNNEILTLLNIHAKAGDLNNDYQRRVSGANIIRDSANILYSNKQLILIGDYNDFLEGSISSNPLSPYSNMFGGTNTLKGISLGSRYPNLRSYAYEPGIIDNICASSGAMESYTGAFTVLEEIENAFSSYRFTTSDHYPTLTFFRKKYTASITNVEDAVNDDLFKIINTGSQLQISATSYGPTEIIIYNLTGQVMYQSTFTNQLLLNKENLTNLAQVLIVQLRNNGFVKTIKF